MLQHQQPLKKTPSRLTKFERTQLIGMRMEQIARGAPTAVAVPEGASVRDVVLAELAERKIPLIVSRTLPNGVIENWRIEEFIEV